jgi:MerR family transcriptional regulator, heat shock protein HspR
VARLTAEGLGLEGVRRVLELENELAVLRERVAALREQLAAANAALATTPNLPVRATTSHQIAVWRRRSP